MANSQVTVRDTQLEKQRLGFINLNLTALTTTAVPDIVSGSAVEVGGSLYSFTANETPTGWAGIANDNQAYIKLTPGASSVTSSFVTTAPTYSSAKGGWYSGDDRYVARVYKDSSGNAIEKTIYVQITNSARVPIDLDIGSDVRVGADVRIGGSLDVVGTSIDFAGSDQDRQIDFASDARVLWDESADEFVITNGVSSYTYGSDEQMAAIVNRVSGGTPTDDFVVYKPIMAYVTWDVDNRTHDLSIQISQNGGWRDGIFTRTGISSETGTEYGLSLNPGSYRVYMHKDVSGDGSTFRIYISGTYGADELSKAYA